jgi:hypothetical protein
MALTDKLKKLREAQYRPDVEAPSAFLLAYSAFFMARVDRSGFVTFRLLSYYERIKIMAKGASFQPQLMTSLSVIRLFIVPSYFIASIPGFHLAYADEA